MTTPDNNKSKASELVFNKYGNHYFLREILCASADMNRAVPASKQEKRAQVQEASIYNPSQVLVALK